MATERGAGEAGTVGEAHRHNVAGVRFAESGRLEEAIASFREAVRHDPSLAAAHLNLGNALVAAGRGAEACDAYRTAVAVEPALARGHLNLGLALLGEGALHEAAQSLERAVDLDPQDMDAASALAIARIRLGALREALDLLDRNLESRPRDARDLSLAAIACARLGDAGRAGALLDLERLVLALTPDVPAGYDGARAFNAALAEHVLDHPSLSRSPAQHATRGGWHSGELLLDPAPVVAALQASIEQAVERYAADRCGADGHPALGPAPDRVTLTAWAVVLESGGYQIPHVHPGGWLSGVYYVRVPEPPADRPHEGAIELGRPDPALAGGGPWDVRVIDPRAGSMVLFPSYVYHRTLPFRAPATRISIAFDVIRDG